MIRSSRSHEKNPTIVDCSAQFAAADNLDFFEYSLREMAANGIGHGGLMAIGLLGQRDLPGHMLRTAQSFLRWDQRPSLWSHAFLLTEDTSRRLLKKRGKVHPLGSLPTAEVALHSRTGEFPPPERNGVTKGRLGLYADAKVDANAALLAIQMSRSEVEAVAARAEDPNHDRIRYDLWSSLGVWQGYLWAQGERPNPLREGVPIFSASYVEMVYEAAGIDLAPGASEQNSAPEHLWNAALWWHDGFANQGRTVHGYYVLRDKGCAVLSWDD